MGAPRKPTQLKVVEGNKGKRKLDHHEPDPEYLNDLTPPDYLIPAAAAVWNEVAPNLRAARLLTKVDVHMLAMGCNAIAQYRAAAAHACADGLIKSKLVVPEAGGDPVAVGEHVNPWLIVQSMSFKQAMSVFQQFGMSPAARTRISVNPQGDLFSNGKTGTDYFT